MARELLATVRSAVLTGLTCAAIFTLILQVAP